ncbi:MAG TPA: chorismate mutase [Anaerolineales bacterium]|nr:chorismate mutase [Anaerolineaceae bacterium]HJO90897.1 chorismate mutase [Anaerolineales bacterium]|tara:strand:- start:4655 stop:5029 length:375 start_codon:yes stop_codon:yes gene_type:complete
MTVCRGVRGAVPVISNTESDILAAAERLLSELIDRNGILSDDIASAIFTTSPDINAEYPAIAARKLGWTNVALLCGHEMNVPHGMQRCLRILIHWNTDKSPEDIVHVYLDRTRSLRPDLYVEEQ